MPLTHNQISERFESLAKSIENQFEQEGYSKQEKMNEFMDRYQDANAKLNLEMLQELQSEYQISDKEARLILKNITKTKSSDDILNIMKQYNLDETGFKVGHRLEDLYKVSLEDAAKEVSLIKDKDKFSGSVLTPGFFSALNSSPDSQYKSIAEVANTLSKYNINDEQIFKLLAWRMEDIKSGKMTLDGVLQNTAKYGFHGVNGQDTGTKPYSFIDSVKEFFGFKSSSESIETPAQEIKAAELIDNTHHTDSNE